MSQLNTDLSVIMASYNHESTIADAIESVLMQETDYSIVIHCLNDASTDNTGTILEDYATKYPDKVKVYTSPNNLGSGKANFYYHRPGTDSSYWTLLAGDDYWTDKNKVQKQLDFLTQAPDYVGCSCNTEIKDEQTGEVSLIEPGLDEWNLFDMIRLSPGVRFYVHPSGIIWRNIHKQTGTFLPPPFKEPSARGDVLLFHAMMTCGKKIKHIREAMTVYRVTGRGVWSKLSKAEQDQANLKLEQSLSKMWLWKHRVYNQIIKLTKLFKG